MTIGVNADDLRAGPHFEVRDLGDSITEVLGHGGRQMVTPDHKHHAAGVARESDHRLTRRIPAPDDDDLATGAADGFARSRAVIDAGTEEILDSRNLQPPPLDAAGQQDRASVERGSVRKLASV